MNIEMKKLDLGLLEGRLLIFGGPYSNLAATIAMKEWADYAGIPAESTLCTGDLVAYCAEPAETLKLVRDWGIHVVMGNCEEAFASEADDCGCGFDEESACSVLSRQWYRYAGERIGMDDRQWIEYLPRMIEFRYAGFGCKVIHAGVASINQFIFESDSLVDKSEQIGTVGTDIVIAGHSGIPFGQKVSAGYWLNAGMIGMPANDGCAGTWFMLIDNDNEVPVVSWHRLEYAAHLSENSTTAAGMPEYGEALTSGLWPSRDILPQWEKQQTGRPLQIQPLALLNGR